MGIVNVFKGLGSERETHRFNGRLRKHLDLDWKHCKMLLGDKEITKNHAVKDDDVVYIREYPGAASAVFVGVMVTVLASVGAAAWAGVTAHRAAREAYRRMQDAIRRIGRDNRRRDVESIPHLSGARNEPAEGKQAPIILGRHLFAPYFLSEPYMRPSGRDGEDLHWYGTFLVGQTGLNLEKLRNGAIDLLSFNDTVYRNDADWTGWTSRTSDGGTVTRESGVLRATGMAWADRPGIDVSNRIVMIRARWTGSNAQKRLFTNSSLGGDNATETPLAREWAWHRVNVTRPDAPFNALFSHPRQAGDGWEVSDLYIGYENVITPSGTYAFDRPPNLDPASPPPFHDPENAIEVRQDGYFEEGIFNDRWADSLEASVEIGRKRKENAGTVGNIFVDDDGPDPVTRESAKFPMRVEVEILVDGLHGWDSNAGQPTNAAVDLRVEWSRDGVDGWQPIPITGGAGHPLGEWRPVNTDDGPGFGLTRNSARQMRFIAAVDLPASAHSDDGAPVHIRATRLTMQHTGSYRSRTLLTAIRTRQYSPRRTRSMGTPPTELVPAKNIVPSLADRFCRIGIRIKVNENTQEHMDRFNVIASMTGRTWDGSRWSPGKTATSNPAAVALEALTGLMHEPSRHDDAELDLESLGALYRWCDSREVTVADSGPRPVKLESCGALTGATRKIDALQRVLATCDAGMYADEFGRLRFWHDDFQTDPIAALNPQRIVSMSESRDLHRRADGQAVRFIDRDGDWGERTERILRPRVEEVQGENPFDPVSYELVTDYHHAMWLARRSMAREILQPGEMTVEVGREGLHYPPGSLLKVAHEGFRIGIGSGEIVENIVANNEIVGIRTMERFDIREDRDYWVDFYVVDGDRNHVVTRQVQSVGEYTDRLMFTSPIAHAHDKPALGNIVSVIDGAREGIGYRVLESKRCVVMDSSPTPTGYRLTLARYDDEIYRTSAVDAIPAYESRIPPTAPRVHGTVPREPYVTPPPAPHIGPNGNWWIGGVDTNVPAKGEGGRSLNFRGEWSPTAFEVDDVFTFQGRAFITITRIAHAGATPPWPLTNPTAAQRFALLADKGADGIDGTDGKHTDTRFAVGSAAGAPPPHTPNADSPGANWRDTPPPEAFDEGVFLWQTMADFRGTGRLTEWSAPARITGPQGKPGQAGPAGNYTETRFRTNDTGTANPGDPVNTDRSPANWSTSMTAPASAGGSVWMIQAWINAAGQLVGTWGAPVMLSSRGTDGDGFSFRGAWSGSVAYALRDVVTDAGMTFMCQQAHPADATRPPSSSTEVGGGSGTAAARWAVWSLKGDDGRSLNFRGEWSPTPFEVDDVFTFQGRAFIAITRITHAGTTPPPQASYRFALFADKGDDGRGIASIDFRFQRTGSATAPTQPWGNAAWLVNAPALDDTNRWLWKIEQITFDSGTPATEDFVTLIAVHGQTGRGISSVTYAFLRNNGSTPPAENDIGWAAWNAAIHMPDAANRFLWYRETTVFTEGDPDVRVGLESIHGETGGAGRGIASITYRWRTSTGAAQPPATPDGANPANSWVTTQPATDATNRWLWFRQITAFTDGGASPPIVGLQAVHGQTGATGNHYALAFRRSAAQPATPTGEQPRGWSDAPPSPDGDPLWMSRGIMNAQGVLQGTWSQPVRIEHEGPPGKDGENGLGIDAIPTDAYAYWSCDDLPEIPDNPAGAVYRNDTDWTGWNNNVNGGTVIREGGVLRITGNAFVTRPAISMGNSTVVMIRARWTGSNEPKHLVLNASGAAGTANTPRLTREWKVYLVPVPANPLPLNAMYALPRVPEDGWEVSDLYIGDGSYLSPLLDSAGGNHITMPAAGRVIPTRGRFGRGLDFLDTQSSMTLSGFPVLAESDFAISFWVSPRDRARQYTPVLFNSNGIRIATSGILNLTLAHGGTVSTNTPIPLNRWTHVIIMRRGGLTVWRIDGSGGQSSAALPPSASWQFILGFMGFNGLIDEVAVFTRALSDEECKALYLTSLSSHPRYQIPREDVRYRGSTAIADLANTGRINGEAIHHGNFIAYTGPDHGVNSIWRPGNVLQRWGNGWRLVQLDSNSRHMYLTALPDIARGTSQVIASRVMTETLLVSNVFAETMFATLIESEVVNILCRLNVGNAANGIQIRGGGSTNVNDSVIQSGNFEERMEGFRIRGDGRVDANRLMCARRFVAGRTWGMNAETLDPNALGGLFAQEQQGIWNYPVHVTGLRAYRNVNLGEPMRDRPADNASSNAVRFFGTRVVAEGSVIRGVVLSGNNITRAILHNWLHGNFQWAIFPAISSSGQVILIKGSIRIDTINLDVNYLHRETVADGNTYRLYGMDSTGRRCFLLVPPNGNIATLVDRGANTNFNGGTAISSFTQFAADITMM